MKVLCFGSLNIDYVYSVDHFVTKGETLSSTRLEVFTGVILAVLLVFLNVENGIEKKQAEIKAREEK